MRLPLVVLAVAVVAASAACYPPSGPLLWAAPEGARSYRVAVKLTATNGDDERIPAQFVLHLHASPLTGKLVLWSSDVFVSPAVVAHGGVLDTTEPFSLDVPGWVPSPLRIDVDSMSVRANRFGATGTFAGRAVVARELEKAEVIAVAGTLEGDEIEDGVRLSRQPAKGAVHPFGPLVIMPTAPLAPDVALDLVTPDGIRVPLTTHLTSGFADRFETTKVLGFATSYVVEARVPIRDLSGRRSDVTPLSFFTMSMPGLITDGTFEGAVPAHYERCTVKESAAGHALEMRVLGSRFTARMPVPQGATHLRFRWWAVPDLWPDRVSVSRADTSVLIGFEGGRAKVTVLPAPDPTFDGRIETAEIALPPEARDEVWVVIGRAWPATPWWDTDFGVFVDDVEVR